MFRRSRKYSPAAGGWLRDADAPFTKVKRMADGEMTALLAGQRSTPGDDLEKDAFEALLRLRERMGKAIGASAVAYAIGLLTLSNMLSGLSASGMEIERDAFGHVSLLLIGITNFWWATTFAKASYVATWFGWRLKAASAADKAATLLRYPEAFPYFAFFPDARGYPRYVWRSRSSLFQLASVVLIVAALLIFAAGAIALNVALAVEVWRSDYPTASAARLIVAGSIVLSLLGMTVPRFSDWKTRYQNYALTSLLSEMAPERQEKAHRRIARVRAHPESEA